MTYVNTSHVMLKEAESEQLTKAAQGVEALFLRHLLSAMRRTAEFGSRSSGATRMYKEMMDDVLAEKLAQSGGIGIARLLLRQLSKADRTEVGAIPEVVAASTPRHTNTCLLESEPWTFRVTEPNTNDNRENER